MKTLIKQILFHSIPVLLGLVFIISGYTKLFPIEPFEFTFVDLGVAGWKTAPFIARFLISLEFFIGLLLIFGLYFRRFTIYLSATTLLIFSIYLIVIIFTNGNNGNCGCFGNTLSMTPLQAIIKNLIMLIICFIIYKFIKGFNYFKFNKLIVGVIALASLSIPHILNYVDIEYSSSYLTKKENHFKLELDSLYKNASVKVPPKSLSKGKHLIAFMSLTCGHCRIAAKKIRIMKEKNPSLPIYFVLNGESRNLKPFYDDTKSQNIDYTILNGRSFVYLAGLDMPAIFLVNNSTVENWITYFDLDQSKVEDWLNK